MARFVIDQGVAIRMLAADQKPAEAHALLAPTLLRSQVLDTLYRQVQSGARSEQDGLALNMRFARLKIRYLGDAVLRRRAWLIAARAGMSSTYDAEYVALTALQADALVTEDDALVALARPFVAVEPFAALRQSAGD